MLSDRNFTLALIHPLEMAPNAVPSLKTPLTSLLHIAHPILLAGMAHTSTAPLASAVSNAGGLGVIGGLGYTPTQLRAMIHELKASLSSPTLPFGVDLALPAVGGTARKTNHDYTKGLLSELVDVIVEEKTTLFVSAVGVPPTNVIEKLHAGNVIVMNMVGHPRHAEKAFEAGVDIVCAQGGEGGGHTGEISGNLLVPACVDVAGRYKPWMLEGAYGMVVAAGGKWDGRGLAGALGMGAVGVWVGTRFVASSEAGCSRAHKEAVVSAGWQDTTRTLVVSGRPLRVKRNEYIAAWERKEDKVKELTEEGIVPMEHDMEEDKDVDFPFLMGMVAASIKDIKPAKQIVEDMVREAVDMMRVTQGYIDGGRQSKL